MNISDRGLDLIKEFESFKNPLPDGRCTAYLCPAGVPTIGWGCTKNVKMGDVWTREQAENGLRRELEKCEAAVARLVTVDMSQGEFDACVSLAYNIGEHAGGFATSSVLRFLNRGKRAEAAEAFALWNKAKVMVDGKRQLKVLRGLTRRRAAEKALFLSREEPGAMPQAVEPPSTPLVTPTNVGAGLGLGTGATFIADPVGTSSMLLAVKSNTGQLLAGVPIGRLWLPLLILAAFCGAAWLWGRKNV